MENNCYLLIQCGYEGIERLIMPSNKPSVLINEINKLRNQIKIVLEKKEKILKENNIIDEWKGDEYWGDLYVNETITSEEYELSNMEPKSLCIQKYDGKCFKCCCRELKVNIDDETY
jgi:hypothetical protein